MVFRRLWGDKGEIPLEVDTVILSEPVEPGGMLTGEVVLRAPDRDVEVQSIHLAAVVDAPGVHKDDGDEGKGHSFASTAASGWFTLKKGEERRSPFRERLRWGTPVSEVNGQRFNGVSLTLHTKVEAEGISTRTDADPVRVAALPLHTAVFDAFTVAGYGCTTSRIVDSTIPDTEYHLYLRQSFLLTRLTGWENPRELELTFHNNAVGCEIYLRRAALHKRHWDDKPPALRYVAAHHDVGRVDFAEEVRRWISEVAALDQGHAGAAG
ncbi:MULTISPECIES: sporulation protein [unclassified Streptomyces]|uniref:sporulation protein n=1 Tax=unclassified Streptomyces TaxID=2593676 RepID=UPI0029A304CA|nr:sporulation protein [Streptomyces sp. DK15]MDX2391105.1 sporulation protein [Streptomyces sp. DK15]